jgi:hypothetical protein
MMKISFKDLQHGILRAIMLLFCSMPLFVSLPSQAATDPRVTDAVFSSALGAYQRSDYARAVKGFRFAASAGHAAAQYYLASMYAQGHGVERNTTEAIRLYKRAAEGGNVDSIKVLGGIYLEGEQVKKNEPEALRWFSLAAERGDMVSQYQAGQLLFYGVGVAKDEAGGARLLLMAEKQGSIAAKAVLSYAFTYGRGVARDADTAKKLLHEVIGSKSVKSDPYLLASLRYNLGELYYAGEQFETTSDLEAAKEVWQQIKKDDTPNESMYRRAQAGIACIEDEKKPSDCAPLRCFIESTSLGCAEPRDEDLVSDWRRQGGLIAQVSFPSNSSDYIPGTALRGGEKGIAVMRTCVDGEGRILGDPIVLSSSGSKLLDEGAIKLAKHSKYIPASVRGKISKFSCATFKVDFAR